MTVVTTVCLVVLSVSLGLVVLFALKSRGLVDRALGLDTMMAVVLNGLAVLIVRTGDPDVVFLALLIAALAFIGTVTVSRFVERRGNELSGEEH